ncbi:MAG: GFA family protein [Pseudomonadota bacterium]
MADLIEGQCLCGAVTVRASTFEPVLRVCHCDMCRRHTSGAFVSIETDPKSVQISGPSKSFRSSDWAERGFCADCGSTLWYRAVEHGTYELAAGLFENAGGATIKLEYFVDQCPQGYAFAGAHERLTAQQTIALFAPEA